MTEKQKSSYPNESFCLESPVLTLCLEVHGLLPVNGLLPVHFLQRPVYGEIK